MRRVPQLAAYVIKFEQKLRCLIDWTDDTQDARAAWVQRVRAHITSSLCISCLTPQCLPCIECCQVPWRLCKATVKTLCCCSHQCGCCCVSSSRSQALIPLCHDWLDPAAELTVLSK